jgi:DNA-binding transcriptional LysR family regulator
MAIESATAAMRRRRSGRQLRLSVPPTLFSHWLIPRLPDFNRRHPQIMLSFAPYRRDDRSDPQTDAWMRIGATTGRTRLAADYLVGRTWCPSATPGRGRRTGHPQARPAGPPAAGPHQLPRQLGRWFSKMGCEDLSRAGGRLRDR